MKTAKKAINAALKDPRKYRSTATQAAFWARFGVTQSGGSRYENGRDMDAPLKALIALDVAGHGNLVDEALALVR